MTSLTLAAGPDDLVVDLSATIEQQEMILCDAIFQTWVTGRRWGKTLSMRNKAVKAGLEFPGHQIWYTSLSNRKSGAEYRRFLKGTRDFTVWTKSTPPYCVKWFNDCEFWFYSMDRPENIRGENCKLLLCDEAAKYNEREYWEILVPCIADVDGRIVLASTVYGENWFWQEFLKGQAPEKNPDHKSFIYTTPTGWAFQSDRGRRTLDILRRNTPAVVWEQEYMCLPAAKADAVFRYAERTEAVPDIRLETKGRAGARYIFGWDTGGKADPSGLIGMEILSADLARVVWRESYPLGMETQIQLVRTKQTLERFTFNGRAPILGIDTTGTHRDWALGWARQQGLQNVNECDFRSANKERMVNELSLRIENGEIKIPREAHQLLAQIKSYRYVLDEKGHYDYRAPDGQHDDEVSGLLICTWGWKNNWAGFTNGLPLRYGIS